MKNYNIRWSARIRGDAVISAPDEESAEQIFYEDTVGNLNPNVDTADDFEIDNIYVEDNPIEEN